MAGTTARATGGRRASIVGINVTPFVDVVLVLLVIMMVSAQYIVSRNLKVELPKATQTDAPATSPTSVTIQADGGLLFNGQPTTEEALRTGLKAALATNPKLDLIISADTAALHGRVVAIIDLAKAVGVTRFAIQIQQGKP